MIRYTLKCTNAHEFDSWFRSGEAFDALRDAGEVACPSCGDSDVEKAVMAPRVGSARREPAAGMPSPDMVAKLRKAVEATSDYVGPNFAREARAIFTGEAPQRSIYGEAKPDEARALVADGVPIAPLPFAPTRKLN